jgi:hypothetical protein
MKMLWMSLICVAAIGMPHEVDAASVTMACAGGRDLYQLSFDTEANTLDATAGFGVVSSASLEVDTPTLLNGLM